MNSIFDQIVPKNTFTPPKVVLQSLERVYGKMLNVEWSEEEGFYEAVFYYKDIEYIARFDSNGELQVSKSNLPLHMVTVPIALRALEVGELMNLIEISQQGKVFYEIIARDKYLDRYYLLLEENGTLLEKQKL
jgi:hypothetical protein